MNGGKGPQVQKVQGKWEKEERSLGVFAGGV